MMTFLKSMRSIAEPEDIRILGFPPADALWLTSLGIRHFLSRVKDDVEMLQKNMLHQISLYGALPIMTAQITPRGILHLRSPEKNLDHTHATVHSLCLKSPEGN